MFVGSMNECGGSSGVQGFPSERSLKEHIKVMSVLTFVILNYFSRL